MAKTTKPAFNFSRYMKVTEPSVPCIICASTGEPASGKSHFAFTAPGPIAYFNLDNGIRGVVDKFKDEKDVYAFEYPWGQIEKNDSDECRATALTVLNTFTEQFNDIVPHVRSAVIDKEDDLWDLVKYSELGAPKGPYTAYEPLHAKMNSFVDLAKRHNVNLFLLKGLTNNWVNKKIEGRKPMGWERAYGKTDINIFHTFDPDTDSWFMRVDKARGPNTTGVQGQTFENLTVPELGVRLYPDGDADVWE